MERRLFNLVCLTASILSGILLFASCVNEEYDLDKEIDMEMTLLQNVSLPVGSLEKFSLDDILKIDTENSTGITITESGDYVISFSGDKFSTEISMPSFSMSSGDEIKSEPISVTFPTGNFQIIEGVIIEEDIVYSDVTDGPLETQLDLEFDTTLPEEVAELQEVMLESLMNVTIATNAGRIYIKPGFYIEFPDNITLSLLNETDDYVLEGGHKVLFQKETSFSADGNPLSIDLMLERITVPEGAIVDSRLAMSETIKIGGDFYLNTGDFTSIPENLTIAVDACISGLDVKSATLKLNVNEEVSGVEVNISSMPDFLAGDNVTLDLYNPVIGFNIINNFPISFDFSTTMKSYQANTTPEINLGNDPKITIPASSTVKYLVSRREVTETGAINIVVPELGDFVSTIPEKISVENILIESASDFITVESSKTYAADFEYWLDTPLAFGEDLDFTYSLDIENLNLEFDGNLKSVELILEMVNSIPLSFELMAEAIDSEGNIVKGMTLNLDKKIPSGTHLSPVSTPVTIAVNNSNDVFSLKGLRMTFKAEGPSVDHIGTALNSAQGLEIKNIVLSVPDGIVINSK